MVDSTEGGMVTWKGTSMWLVNFTALTARYYFPAIVILIDGKEVTALSSNCLLCLPNVKPSLISGIRLRKSQDAGHQISSDENHLVRRVDTTLPKGTHVLLPSCCIISSKIILHQLGSTRKHRIHSILSSHLSRPRSHTTSQLQGIHTRRVISRDTHIETRYSTSQHPTPVTAKPPHLNHRSHSPN